MSLTLKLLSLLSFSFACGSPQEGRFSEELPKGIYIDHLKVYKQKGVMQTWYKGEHIKRYKISVGRGNSGPKRIEGDKKTPEGRYYIDERHKSSRFHRFLHISYPNAADQIAFRALKRSQKGIRIGSAIGLHGEQRGLSWLPHKWMNWTSGCIAVDDDEIEELYRAVQPGALIEIFP